MANPATGSARRVAPAVLGIAAVLAAAAAAVTAAKPENRIGTGAGGEGPGGPVAVAAALSPDGSRVAIAADTGEGGADELYLVQTDGSGLRGVATGMTFYPTAPLAFSADGAQILFVGYEAGDDRPAVFRVRVDGAGQTRLSDFSGSLPAFSPDGGRIAFSVSDPEPSGPDPSGTEPSGPDPSGAEAPGAEPTGTASPGTGPAGTAPPEGGADEDLYVANVDGSGRKALTTLEGEEYAPAFSPDGTLVAFERRVSPGLPSVWVVRADGSDPRRVTPAHTPATSPQFTADGKRIVFTSGVDDSAAEYGAYSVAVTSPGPPQPHDGARSASHERGGKRVYVEDGDVFVENTDGGDRRQLTDWG